MMKQLFFLILFLCSFSFVTIAQENSNTIVITGGSSIGTSDSISIYDKVYRNADSLEICEINRLFHGGALVRVDTIFCEPTPCCGDSDFLCRDSLLFWEKTRIITVDSFVHTLFSRSERDCRIDSVEIGIRQADLAFPPISKLSFIRSGEKDRVMINTINSKPDQTQLDCDECARLEFYIDFGKGVKHYETIIGKTGALQSEVNSTMQNGYTESSLNHIVATDTIFDCSGATDFEFNANSFVLALADSLGLVDPVIFNIYSYVGGTNCSNSSNVLYREESNNSDNFISFCQEVNLVSVSANYVASSAIDTVTFSNLALHDVGDTTAMKIIIDHSDSLTFIIESDTWCLLPDQLSNKADVTAASRVTTVTHCNNVDSTSNTSHFKITLEQPLDCFSLKLEDLDVAGNGLLTEAIYNITPAAISFEPITNATVNDLNIERDPFGHIVGIEPLTPDNTLFIKFYDTKEVEFDVYRRTNVSMKIGEIKLCSCDE